MAMKHIVVIGAGVSGLTTALLLSKATTPEQKLEITVLAKHMPGDYSVEYCSPWAGADFMPTACEEDSKTADYLRRTWPWFRDLAKGCPEAGVHFQATTVYTRTIDDEAGNIKFPVDPWWKELFPDYRDLPPHSLPAGIARAASFTTVCINTAIYLPWLLSQCLAAGTVFKRATLKDISSACLHNPSESKPVDLVLNCTGLGSFTLGGVEDKSMYPIRGQIAVVRNSISEFSRHLDGKDGTGIYSLSGTDGPEDESCYGMTRAAGGGTVLGGCSIVGSWDGDVDLEMAGRLLDRARDMCRDVIGAGEEAQKKGEEIQWDVIRHGVGLRPARRGGIRVESECFDLGSGGDGNGNLAQGHGRKGWVVHNYGHAGEGYQCSIGCAQDAVALVESIFADV